MRTVLQNATVIDGTGAAPGDADVVVSDGTIVEVGRGLDGDPANATHVWLGGELVASVEAE